ncbi:hypothetical protein ACFX2B_031280 [Malus domestica]
MEKGALLRLKLMEYHKWLKHLSIFQALFLLRMPSWIGAQSTSIGFVRKLQHFHARSCCIRALMIWEAI